MLEKNRSAIFSLTYVNILHMRRKRLRLILYISGFFIALQAAIPAYINSSFIEQYLPSEKLVGFLYTIAAIFTIIGLLIIPLILKKIGNFATIMTIASLNIIILLVLVLSQNANLILFSFIVYLILSAIIYFNLDIFLEQQSDDKNTGRIRGIYLSLINVAWVISPLLAGLLLTNGDYWKIYFLATIVSIPSILLLIFGFRKFKDPIYNTASLFKASKKVLKIKAIRKVLMVRFFLHFFYAWMIIYTPIYLHKHIGFDWQTIGLIFTIMLLPFILFQLPLGKLADRKLGEKEILNCGIVIISLSTIALFFLNSSIFWVWAIFLFMTRVGASAVQITSESYFFKHVNAKDTHMVSFFRIVDPLAYSIAPLVASLVLLFLDFRYIFLVLGIIVLFALKYGLTLKDTR